MASVNGRWAAAAWEKMHPDKGAPVWLKKDWVNLAKLEHMLGDRFKPTWTNYLYCRTPFFAGHAPGKLLANLGQFLVQPDPAVEEAQEPQHLSGMSDEEFFGWGEKQLKIRHEAEIEAERRRNRHQSGVRQAMTRSTKLSRQEAREALRALKGGIKP